EIDELGTRRELRTNLFYAQNLFEAARAEELGAKNDRHAAFAEPLAEEILSELHQNEILDGNSTIMGPVRASPGFGLAIGAPARLAIAYGPPDTLCETAPLNYARTQHRATRLPSGAVLISGGVDGTAANGGPVGRLELYLPSGDLLTPVAGFRVVDPNGSTR